MYQHTVVPLQKFSCQNFASTFQLEELTMGTQCTVLVWYPNHTTVSCLILEISNSQSQTQCTKFVLLSDILGLESLCTQNTYSEKWSSRQDQNEHERSSVVQLQYNFSFYLSAVTQIYVGYYSLLWSPANVRQTIERSSEGIWVSPSAVEVTFFIILIKFLIHNRNTVKTDAAFV